MKHFTFAEVVAAYRERYGCDASDMGELAELKCELELGTEPSSTPQRNLSGATSAPEGQPIERDDFGGTRLDNPIAPIKPSPFTWRDPATIPRRQWLYARHFIRKFVGCTFAAGGVGKSTLELADAIAMASGRPLLGHAPASPLRVWVWNGEDPREEIERRVAAICLHFNVAPEEIGDRLFIDSGRDLEIVVARAERAGFSLAVPVVDAVQRAISEAKIDVLIVDPFVACHRVSENDNGAIDAVAKTWAKIADATGCAIELVHHVRKTGGAEITAEDGRGASSLIAAARSVRVLNIMSEDEAARANVETRRAYFRVDNGKANLAPPPEKSDWFRIVSVGLGNGDGGSEDFVGVATAWEWPDAFDGLSVADLRKVQDRLAQGEHAESAQAKNWAGYAVGEVLDIDATTKAGRTRIKSLLATWIKNEALKVELRHNQRTGRDQRLIVAGERA